MSTRRIYLLVIVILVICGTHFSPVLQISAQTSLDMVFLAHADDDKSGAILLQSSVHLYLTTNNNVVVLSKPDEDVSDFAISNDLSKIAYVAQAAGKLNLEIMQTADRMTVSVDLPSLTSITSLLYSPTLIWITGISADHKVELIGIDPLQIKLVARQTSFPADTNLILSDSGKWLLAYAPSNTPQLLTLPDFSPVELKSTIAPISFAQWSPTLDLVQMMPASGQSVLLVDPTTGQVTAVALPLQDSTATVSAEWSGNGRFVVATETDADASGAITRINVMLLDPATKNITPVMPASVRKIWNWAAKDELALVYAETSNADASVSVFNPTTQMTTPVKGPSGVQFVTGAWNPGATSLGLVGQSPSLKQYGVFTSSSIPGDSLKSIFVSTDEQIAQSSLYWSADGSHLVLVSPSAGSVDASGKAILTGGQIFTIDAASGAFNRITSDNLSVLDVHVFVH